MGGKHQSDSLSAMSMAARSSERGRKPPRFSLRRIFYRARSSATPKPMRVMRSQSEIETRSNSSVQSSHAADRDTPLHSMQGTSEVVAITTSAKGVKNKESAECPVCMTWQPREHFPPVMTCHHRSCQDCLKKYMKIEITESRINITCPECNERFHPNDIKAILEDEDLMGKYEEFMMRRILVSDPDTRWCPAPDCGYAVIAAGCASCPKLHCERPGCDTFFCYHCKQYWHPNQTCDAARAERSSNLRSSSVSYSHESGSQNDIKPCPRCGAFINKMDDGSCNHMTCAVCGAEFCWLCMKEISDLHYLSPSGCTFWGKKPWSRKKKILWQLGTLVGAPVGIALIAGIAVPAIIIGVPVWVGRRLHTRYSHMNKHKRNLVVAGGVMASILVSPILAGLAVGIGVPILLAYVYGVVPISLCRSGGCGVTTTDSGGVRFEFDDDNNEGAATAPYPGTDTQSVDATVHNVANPSIGPSIGEMSVAMTGSLSASGSHMDRVGVLRDDCDRDSASQRALAGASLTGSLCDSGMPTTSSYHNRLEVQADVSSGAGLKRNSLSSESANFSLDAKSATVSFGDDVSTKALAGSICNRDKDGVSAILPPLEVQVDVLHSSAYYQNGAIGHESHPPHRGQGSPTSNRSVNFAGDEIIGQAGPSRRKYKTQNISVGDSIHEYSETDLEEGSTSKLGAMDSENLAAGDKHSYMGSTADNVSLVMDESSVASASFSHNGVNSKSPRDSTLTPSDVIPRCHSNSISPSPSPRSSISGDCMGRSGGLTEVENDRPFMSTLSAHSARSRSLSTCSSHSTAGSTASSGTDTLTVIDHPSLEGTTNCAFHCESPEEEAEGHTSKDSSKGCVSVSVTLPMPCDLDQSGQVTKMASHDVSVSISVPRLSSTSSNSSRSSNSSGGSTHSQQALLDADLATFSRCNSLHTCESGESLEGAVGFTHSSPSMSSGSGSICETSVLINATHLSSGSSTSS